MSTLTKEQQAHLDAHLDGFIKGFKNLQIRHQLNDFKIGLRIAHAEAQDCRPPCEWRTVLVNGQEVQVCHCPPAASE